MVTVRIYTVNSRSFWKLFTDKENAGETSTIGSARVLAPVWPTQMDRLTSPEQATCGMVHSHHVRREEEQRPWRDEGRGSLGAGVGAWALPSHRGHV